jgi:hypothetical protein
MCQNSLSVRSYENIKARVRAIRNLEASSRYKQLHLKLSTKFVQERLLSQDGSFLLTDSGDTIVIGVCFA